MKQALVLCLFFGLVVSLSAQQTSTENFSIYFNVNEHTLDAKDKLTLSKHLKFDGDTMFYHIKLEGHADVDGDAQANYELSQRRIESIRKFMLAHGVAKKDISIAAHGERMQSSNVKWKNRRVDVTMTFSNVLASNDQSGGKVVSTTGGDPHSIDIANEVFADYIKIENADPSIFGMENDGRPESKKIIIAENGATLRFPSGTKITIPSKSLLHKNGDAVVGEVEVFYTEFRDPVDIMFSRIPMTYDSAGTQYIMDSGGMFDIKAKQGDEELVLAPGATIDIEFAQTSNDTDFNFYQTNDDGHWANANDMMDDPPVNNKYANVNLNGWLATWKASPFLEHYDPKYAAIQTGYLWFKNKDKGAMESDFQSRWPSFEYGGTTKADLKKSKYDRYIFNLDLRRAEPNKSDRWNEIMISDLTGENKELNAYKSQVFQVQDEEFVKNFKQYNKACDMRIIYHKAQNNFTLLFKYVDEIKKVKACILYPPNKTQKEQEKLNRERNKYYQSALEHRAGSFDAELKLQYMRKQGPEVTLELHAFWHFSKEFMPEKEELLSINEWMQHFHNNPKMMKARYAKQYKKYHKEIKLMNENPKIRPALAASYEGGANGIISYTAKKKPACGEFEPEILIVDYTSDSLYNEAVDFISMLIDTTQSKYVQDYLRGQIMRLSRAKDAKVLQKLSIDEFGVWNVDKLWKLDKKEEVLVAYADESGQPITPVYMSMLFIEQNAALSQNPFKFKYSRVVKSHVVLIDAKSNYYIITDKELKAGLRGKSAKYKLTPKRVDIKKPGDLKKILNI